MLLKNKVKLLIVGLIGVAILIGGSIYLVMKKKEADRKSALLALNYCQESISRIVNYNDRIVLDQEYDRIINNINLSKIKDSEIVDLLLGLMDTLDEYRLSEGDKKLIAVEYEEAMQEVVTKGLAAAGNLVTGNWLALAADLVNYCPNVGNNKGPNSQFQSGQWSVDRKLIEELNILRKEMVKISWVLIQKHELSDQTRLTEDSVDLYVELLQDDNLDRRYRKLMRLKSEFAEYPPYWCYLGKTKMGLGLNKDAIEYFHYYLDVEQNIFKSNAMTSSVLMDLVTLLDKKEDYKEIINCLSRLTSEFGHDPFVRQFCALYYMSIEHHKSAHKLFQANIDDNYLVSLNYKFLGEAAILAKSDKLLNQQLEIMLESDEIRNFEILYLVGQADDEKVVNYLREQILGISLAPIEKPKAKNSSVSVSIPEKWFFDGCDVFISLGGLNFYPVSAIPSVDSEGVSFLFADVYYDTVDLESRGIKSISLTLADPSSISVLLEYEIIVDSVYTDNLWSKMYTDEKTASWLRKELKERGLSNQSVEKTMRFSLVKVMSNGITYSVHEGNIEVVKNDTN